MAGRESQAAEPVSIEEHWLLPADGRRTPAERLLADPAAATAVSTVSGIGYADGINSCPSAFGSVTDCDYLPRVLLPSLII